MLVFTENDFDNFNGNATLAQDTVERPPLVNWLFRHSALFRGVALRWNLYGLSAASDPHHWNQKALGGNNVVAGLERLSELADRHGFDARIVVWPNFDKHRISDRHPMPGTKTLIIERLAAMHKIPIARLSPFFINDWQENHTRKSPRDHYTIGDGMHPSPAGHTYAASVLHYLLSDETAWHRGDARTWGIHDADAVAAAAALGTREPDRALLHYTLGSDLLTRGKTS
ncbi:unnamed protein product, partial [marine sediment metagenome]